jgi:hypothetical protein
VGDFVELADENVFRARNAQDVGIDEPKNVNSLIG